MKSYSRNVTNVDKLVQLHSRFLVARPKFGLQVERWLLDQSPNWSQLISNSANQLFFKPFSLFVCFLKQWHKQQPMWCIQTLEATVVQSAERQQRNFSHFTDTHVSLGCVCAAWGICAAQTCMYKWQMWQSSAVVNNHLLVTLKPKRNPRNLLYSHMLFIFCTAVCQLSSTLISTKKLNREVQGSLFWYMWTLLCSAGMQPQGEAPIHFTAILGDLKEQLRAQVCLDHNCPDIQYEIY